MQKIARLARADWPAPELPSSIAESRAMRLGPVLIRTVADRTRRFDGERPKSRKFRPAHGLQS
jgi:hypothetical protein